jgi:hypothetical protein
LFITVLFDAARVRTQWLAKLDDGVAGALTASLFVKCIMLVLEAMEKRSLLFGLDRHFSQESTSGVISRSSFWWLNSLMLSGSKNFLTVDELPVIHEKLNSEDLARELQPIWANCKLHVAIFVTKTHVLQATKSANTPWRLHVPGVFAGKFWAFTCQDSAMWH